MTLERSQTFVDVDSPGAGPIDGTTHTRQLVINLCTLAAPITVPQPRAPRLTRYSFFLSRTRVNDRSQYRLHMGYFSSTAEAQKWLTTLKRVYPDAYISAAPKSQPDLLSDTQQLRILNIGRVDGGGDDTPPTVTPRAVGNTKALNNTAPPKQRTANEPPASRELFVRDTNAAPTESRRIRPSLEDTLNELRTSEFDMGADDDANTTGVRHLRVDIMSESAGARSAQRPGSRTRR